MVGVAEPNGSSRGAGAGERADFLSPPFLASPPPAFGGVAAAGGFDAGAFVFDLGAISHEEWGLWALEEESQSLRLFGTRSYCRTVLPQRRATVRHDHQTLVDTVVDTALTSALTAFPELISFDPGNHSFLLHPTFKAAIADAETNANIHRMAHQPKQQPPRAQQQQDA